MNTVFALLAEQPILYLFLVLGIGMAFGHVKVKGVSLGAAAVLFSAATALVIGILILFIPFVEKLIDLS